MKYTNQLLSKEMVSPFWHTIKFLRTGVGSLGDIMSVENIRLSLYLSFQLF